MPIETGNEPPRCALCGKIGKRGELSAVEEEVARHAGDHAAVAESLELEFARMVELQELQLDLLQELADGRALD